MGEACPNAVGFAMIANSSSGEISPAHPWYALKVRTRSEPVASVGLRNRGYDPFCPTYAERRRYCDRMKIVDKPVFPGYLFCRFDTSKKLPVISSHAVEYIVGVNGVPAPIPEEQIAHIRRAVEAGAIPAPYLEVGERVRVQLGALAGVEGVLVRDASRGRLVVSVDLLQRSVAVEIDEDQVQPA
jgi:transcription antitermination factor NusG